MGFKRKRSTTANRDTSNPSPVLPNKRRCLRPYKDSIPPPLFEHPVLSLYFTRLLMLRKYLEIGSHGNTRLIAKLGAVDATTDPELSSLLDSTIVGLSTGGDIDPPKIDKEIADATPGSGQLNTAQSDVSISLPRCCGKSNRLSANAAFSSSRMFCEYCSNGPLAPHRDLEMLCTPASRTTYSVWDARFRECGCSTHTPIVTSTPLSLNCGRDSCK